MKLKNIFRSNNMHIFSKGIINNDFNFVELKLTEYIFHIKIRKHLKKIPKLMFFKWNSRFYLFFSISQTKLIKFGFFSPNWKLLQKIDSSAFQMYSNLHFSIYFAYYLLNYTLQCQLLQRKHFKISEKIFES